MTPERLFDLARRRCQAAEVFAVAAEETPAAFEANRLKTLSTRQTSGLALRVVVDGRLGFASSTAADAPEQLLAMALETAPYGPEARFQFPGTDGLPTVEVYDPAVEAVSVEAMAALGQELIDRLRRQAPALLCDATVRKAVQTVRLLNSSGGDVSYRRSVFAVSLEGTLVRGTDMLFVGDGEASCRPIADVGGVVETILRQLELARETASPASGQLPVIFTPQGVASALVAPLSLAFSGRTVWQGASPIGGALGQQAYHRSFSLWNDALAPWRPASRPCDDEGVASRRLPLVESGVVANFLYDLQTAALAGAGSTGSAGRSLASPPAIAPSALIFGAGEASLDDMVAEAKNGLLVERLMGAGQGNVLGGDFAGNVLLGYKIEDGRIVGRVKDTMVAGNVHQALKDGVVFGREGRWVGASLWTPPILCARLSVAGRA